jgi:hypothetical protein
VPIFCGTGYQPVVSVPAHIAGTPAIQQNNPRPPAVILGAVEPFLVESTAYRRSVRSTALTAKLAVPQKHGQTR